MDWLQLLPWKYMKSNPDVYFLNWIFSLPTNKYFFSEQYIFNLGGDFYGKVQSQEELSKKNTLLGSIYDLQVRGTFSKKITHVTGSW